MAFRYTPAMKAFIKKSYLTMDYKQVTALFNETFGTDKTRVQIQCVIKNNGYHSAPDKKRASSAPYSPEQLTWLKTHYRNLSVNQLTPAFNQEFGTNKSPGQIYRCLDRHNIKSSDDGLYNKNRPAWNKGKKGWTAPGNSEKTRFKKGGTPSNQKPIGHESVNSHDGYVYIKVDQVNPFTKTRGWYRKKHVVTWEQHHGPVPAGYCVLIKDGNKNNCSDINNLMLVTRAQLGQLNKTGLITAPAELKEAAVATVDLSLRLAQIARDNPEN